MKIGIIADTHDHVPKIARAVECFNDLRVDRVYHAGDFVAPFALARFERLACPMVGVFGNNDGDKQRLLAKAESLGISLHHPPYIAQLDTLSLLIMHEPTDLEALTDRGEHDLIVYGHTHRTDERRRGRTLVLNPGETCGWQYESCTIMVLDLARMAPEVITL